MALPTRAQLEAAVLAPTVTVEWHNGSAWSNISQHVIRTRVQTSLPRVFDLGAASLPTATVTLTRDALSLVPAFAPIRISYGLVGTASQRRFVGYVTDMTRTPNDVVWTCQGVGSAIAAQSIRVAVRRGRPPHTPTTATSIEDPNHSSYRAGMINEVFWRAGGRPWQQQSVYPNAPWYYDCSSALITPEWTWLDSENAWEDIARLCRAVGSIVYQDEQGVVRCRSVAHAISGTPTYHWSDQPLTAAQRVAQNTGLYHDIEEQVTWQDVPSEITVRYVRRGLTGIVQCYSDTTARLLAPSQSIPLTLEAQQPITEVQRIEIDAASTATGLSVTVTQSTPSVSAHTVSLTVTNPSATDTVLISGIRVFGRIIEAIEEGSHTATRSATTVTQRTMRTEDNPYVQTESHARALARLLLDLYGRARNEIVLRRCTSDVDRYVGEIVRVTSSALGYSNQRAVISAINNDTNQWMDVTVIPLFDFPAIDEFYVIDATYGSSDTRLVGY